MNFEEFKKNLSNEEQEQLFAYLPDVDTAKLSERLIHLSEKTLCACDHYCVCIGSSYK